MHVFLSYVVCDQFAESFICCLLYRLKLLSLCRRTQFGTLYAEVILLHNYPDSNLGSQPVHSDLKPFEVAI